MPLAKRIRPLRHSILDTDIIAIYFATRAPRLFCLLYRRFAAPLFEMPSFLLFDYSRYDFLADADFFDFRRCRAFFAAFHFFSMPDAIALIYRRDFLLRVLRMRDY